MGERESRIAEAGAARTAVAPFARLPGVLLWGTSSGRKPSTIGHYDAMGACCCCRSGRAGSAGHYIQVDDNECLIARLQGDRVRSAAAACLSHSAAPMGPIMVDCGPKVCNDDDDEWITFIVSCC